MAFFTVCCVVDHIAGIGQGIDQLPVDVGIIFYDKYAHSKFLFATEPTTELAAHYGPRLSINLDNVQLPLVASLNNIAWGSPAGKAHIKQLAGGRDLARDSRSRRGCNEILTVGLRKSIISRNTEPCALQRR